MPDALRTPYEGDLRSDLMAAAIDAIARDGPSKVSLRALARHLGVSHAAPKNHFASKRALFTAVAADGHLLLEGAIARELEPARDHDPVPAAGDEGSPDAVGLLAAAGRGYLRFAQDHPAHFAVMFRDDLLDPDDDELKQAAERTLGQLAELAGASTSDLEIAPGDVPVLVLLAWSLVHGLASLHAGSDLADIVGDQSRTDIDDAVVALMARLMRGGRSAPST